jgi:hypothetical protein
MKQCTPENTAGNRMLTESSNGMEPAWTSAAALTNVRQRLS